MVISGSMSFLLNHIIRHRGRLTVYLRLDAVPDPGIGLPAVDQN